MGHATALVADGFYDVKYSLIEQYLERGTWVMARGTLAAALLLKDGTGNYLWNPNYREDREDKHSTLLGLPVRMSTTMPAVAAGALSVALADWKEAYTIVDRLGITIQRDPFTVKPMVEFYTRKRVGGDITNFQSIKIGVVAA
jgi:HK97 family phage major capsid protein